MTDNSSDRNGYWSAARRIRLLTAAALFLALLSSPSEAPVARSAGFTPFMSTSQEKRLGTAEHPKILESYGGAYKDDRSAGYVAQVGGTVVSNSELPANEFTFTLLNANIINAFALPGGYIYISRQLLGLMNDEAELASVLGHEAGHVTDRHTAKRYNRGIWGQILAVGAGIATGSGQIASLVGQVSQMDTLRYSRNQEFKADSLGVRYIAAAGYDPYAAADMLRSLGAQTALDARLMGQDYERVPTWARTHPLTQDRVGRADQLARDTKIAPGTRPRNPDRFLNAIDGLLMDDDPEQGFIRGRTFSHTKLMLTFTVPEGYSLQNGSSQVIARGPQNAAVIFSSAKLDRGGLDGMNQKIWAAVGEQVLGIRLGSPGVSNSTTINGLPTAILSSRVRAQNGAAVDVAIVSYQWSNDSAYYFAVITPAELTQQVDQGLRKMTESFRRLSKTEADALVERRIRVVTVKPGETADILAKRMAYDDNQMDRFLILNSLGKASDLRAGQKVKLIVYARS